MRFYIFLANSYRRKKIKNLLELNLDEFIKQSSYQYDYSLLRIKILRDNFEGKNYKTWNKILDLFINNDLPEQTMGNILKAPLDQWKTYEKYNIAWKTFNLLKNNINEYDKLDFEISTFKATIFEIIEKIQTQGVSLKKPFHKFSENTIKIIIEFLIKLKNSITYPVKFFDLLEFENSERLLYDAQTYWFFLEESQEEDFIVEILKKQINEKKFLVKKFFLDLLNRDALNRLIKNEKFSKLLLDDLNYEKIFIKNINVNIFYEKENIYRKLKNKMQKIDFKNTNIPKINIK